MWSQPNLRHNTSGNLWLVVLRYFIKDHKEPHVWVAIHPYKDTDHDSTPIKNQCVTAQTNRQGNVHSRCALQPWPCHGQYQPLYCSVGGNSSCLWSMRTRKHSTSVQCIPLSPLPPPFFPLQFAATLFVCVRLVLMGCWCRPICLISFAKRLQRKPATNAVFPLVDKAMPNYMCKGIQVFTLTNNTSRSWCHKTMQVVFNIYFWWSFGCRMGI